jgi:PAS domain-containing protein
MPRISLRQDSSMDVPHFFLPDLPSLARLTALPDAVMAALVSAVATMALVVAFSARFGRSRAPILPATADAVASEFLIDGATVRPLTEPARHLLGALAPGGTRLGALARHFAADCPDLQDNLETLVLYGTPFRHHCLRADGSALEIIGDPKGGAARLSIRPASEDARALQDARAALARITEERDFLSGLLDRAPVLAWSHAPDGQVVWANAPYRDRFDPLGPALPDHRIPDAFGRTIEEVPLTARGADSRRRASVSDRDDGAPTWFEVSKGTGPAGEAIGFALDASEIVAAEASLRRFVETLTETFAHLPIGLAVFDKNRRLGLFNPALTELVKIDAVWLAGRPSLRDFLERLRETRQMPEQKDFAAWRRTLTMLEEGAREGTYEESWVLPSGKIFRVTGRPHPQGALAFLFEDISTTIMLERKYRSELELSRATLDRLTEAVAVFDASGVLAFVNSAFQRLWQFDPKTRLEHPGVAEMTAFWAERCAASTVWTRIAEYATAGEARTSWSDRVETSDGRQVSVLVAPLPDASALVVFQDAGATPAAGLAPSRDDGLGELALEQLRLPAKAAIQKLLTAISTAPSTGNFQALAGPVQGLSDGLTSAEELRAAGDGAPAGSPLPDLAAALAGRGLSLSVPVEASAWPSGARRVALALGLAAADLAAPTATITLSLAGDALIASVSPAREARTDGPGVALARRLAEASGATLSLRRDGDTAVLATTLAQEPHELRRRA